MDNNENKRKQSDAEDDSGRNCSMTDEVMPAGTVAREMPILEITDSGIADCDKTFRRQRLLSEKMEAQRLNGKPVMREYLILAVHTGDDESPRNGKNTPRPDNSEGIQDCDDIFMGAGQLAAYPVIDFNAHHLDEKGLIRLLEDAAIMTIRAYGLEGVRSEKSSGVSLGKGTPEERIICHIESREIDSEAAYRLDIYANSAPSDCRKTRQDSIGERLMTSIAYETGRVVDLRKLKAIFASTFISIISTHH